jgi:hypothetical protein
MDYGVETIDDWIEALNRFCHANIVKWKKDVAKREQEEESRKGNDNACDDYDKERSKALIWAYQAGYGYGPPYSDLIQYGMGMTPDGEKNPTVVYNSFTPEGMPNSFLPPNQRDEEEEETVESDVAICTRDFFERSSIQLMLTGHKPQGDMPSPIRVDQSSWVICADTSYSGDTIWWYENNNNNNNNNQKKTSEMEHSRDGTTSVSSTMTTSQRRSNLGRGNALSFRGDVAVSEVLVSLSDHGQSLDSVKYHGVLSDGTEYESMNLLDAASQNTTLGQVAPDELVPGVLDSPHQGRWWTKSIFSDGSHLFHAGEGFNVWNYVVQKVNSPSSST